MPQTGVRICLYRIDLIKRDSQHFGHHLFLHPHVIISHIMGTAVQDTGSVFVHLQHQCRDVAVRAEAVIAVDTQRYPYADPIASVPGFFLFLTDILIMDKLFGSS